MQKDISKLSGQEILDFCKIGKGELDVLDGSPPCQGFSTAGKRIVSDTRNDLFGHNIRLIDEIEPKIFVIENVSGMIKGTMKGRFNGYMKQLKELPYQVKCKLMNAKYYNVPQSRQRVIFIGVRKDLGIEPSYPEPNKEVIIFKEAVENIINNEIPPPLSTCFLKWIPLMKQGQSVADVSRENKHFQTVRIYNNKVCPTITKVIGGIGFGSLIHPIEDRVLTVRELLRVCSFPDDFILIGKYQDKKARLGNAVMPNMMKAIAGHIRKEILEKAELIK